MNDTNKISNSIFDIMLLLNKKIINPDVMMKNNVIPPSNVRVLLYIKEYGPAPISEVGRQLDISNPNMSRIVENLIQGNYMKRCYDTKDRRIVRLELTENGIAFLIELRNQMLFDINKKLDVIDADNLDKLSLHLNGLQDILNKL